MTWSALAVAALLAAAVLVLPSRRVDGPPDVHEIDAKDDGLRGGERRDPDFGHEGHEGPEGHKGTGRRARRDALDQPSTNGHAETRDTDEVASAMALLALAYRTGLPTWQVLTAVAQSSPDAVASDLRQVATALQWGASEAEAWASVGPAWAAAARVVSLAHAGGVPPGPLLTAASDDLHRAALDRLEVAAAQVGVRLVAPLGLVLLPAFCLTTVVPLVVALGSQLLVG